MKKTAITLIVIQVVFLIFTGVVGSEEAKTEAPAQVAVPAGTLMMVKLDQTLNSKQHRAGHKFTATIEGDMVANGTVVAPHGSRVYGLISESKKSGRLVGKSEMLIGFTHIMVNNQLKPIQTSGVKAVTDGTGKRTVGTTARGATIGGLIDGKDGAKTGAAVGLGVSILTRGNSINIPAGTLLEFTLAAPFTP